MLDTVGTWVSLITLDITLEMMSDPGGVGGKNLESPRLALGTAVTRLSMRPARAH